MKRIALAVLMFAASTLALADTFFGEIAFNPKGTTLTQAEGMRGTDMAVLFFVAPEVIGTYTITVQSAPDSPYMMSHFAIINGDEGDVDFGYGSKITFTVSVGPDGQLVPGEFYNLWVHNTTPTGKDSCYKWSWCNITATIRRVH